MLKIVILPTAIFIAFCAALRLESAVLYDLTRTQFLEYALPGEAPNLEVKAIQNHDSVFLQLSASNFHFSTECLNPGDALTGHAHIYLDGIKYTTAYGSNTVLNNLDSGSREITVTLNASPDHKFLTHNGKVIQKTVTVDIP